MSKYDHVCHDMHVQDNYRYKPSSGSGGNYVRQDYLAQEHQKLAYQRERNARWKADDDRRFEESQRQKIKDAIKFLPIAVQNVAVPKTAVELYQEGTKLLPIIDLKSPATQEGKQAAMQMIAHDFTAAMLFGHVGSAKSLDAYIYARWDKDGTHDKLIDNLHADLANYHVPRDCKANSTLVADRTPEFHATVTKCVQFIQSNAAQYGKCQINLKMYNSAHAQFNSLVPEQYKLFPHSIPDLTNIQIVDTDAFPEDDFCGSCCTIC